MTARGMRVLLRPASRARRTHATHAPDTRMHHTHSPCLFDTPPLPPPTHTGPSSPASAPTRPCLKTPTTCPSRWLWLSTSLTCCRRRPHPSACGSGCARGALPVSLPGGSGCCFGSMQQHPHKHTHTHTTLRRTCPHARASHAAAPPRRLQQAGLPRASRVFMVSALKGLGVGEMCKALRDDMGFRADLWVVGAQNGAPTLPVTCQRGACACCCAWCVRVRVRVAGAQPAAAALANTHHDTRGSMHVCTPSPHTQHSAAGKSSLIAAMRRAGGSSASFAAAPAPAAAAAAGDPTIAPIPGTTLGLLRVPGVPLGPKHRTFDTPGAVCVWEGGGRRGGGSSDAGGGAAGTSSNMPAGARPTLTHMLHSRTLHTHARARTPPPPPPQACRTPTS
jgi:hypothetical protein